jgi:uncharacterized membrane protein YsdA (DUF1294 family)
MQPLLDTLLDTILQSPVLIYYTAINLVVALLYLIDKLKAIGRRWRIPEKTPLLLSVFGGAFGVSWDLGIPTQNSEFQVLGD